MDHAGDECKVLLDADAYPHLIDYLLLAAPLDTLLAFRGTSHALKARVDHLIKTQGLHMVVKHGPNGPIVAFREGNVTLVPSGSHLPSCAHTLDLEGEVITNGLQRLELDVKDLRTVRVPKFRGIRTSLEFCCPNLVVSMNAFPDPEGEVEVWPYATLIQPGVTRVVLNIVTSGQYAEGALSFAQQAAFRLTSTVEQVVFIFSQAAAPAVPNPSPRIQPRGRIDLEQSIRSLVFEFPDVNFTFVDVGFLGPHFTTDVKVTDRHHQIMQNVVTSAARRRDWNTTQECELSFFRLHEYRERVGEEAFALDTLV